jgi:hypothetical protein
MPGLSYGKPNSSQRAATLSISALLTLLTGGNFASLNFMVASIPIPRLGGSKSTSPRSRCCTLLAACWSLLPVYVSTPLFWKSSWIIQPGFRNSIAKTPNCAASKSFLLLACCFVGNVLTHSTCHCCHAQRQNALSSLSKVCSSLMTYVQLRNLT